MPCCREEVDLLTWLLDLEEENCLPPWKPIWLLVLERSTAGRTSLMALLGRWMALDWKCKILSASKT